MFCGNCGQPISEGEMFCPNCGAAQQGAENKGDNAAVIQGTDFLGESNTVDGAVSDLGEASNQEFSGAGAVTTAQTVPVIEPTVVKPEKRRRKPMKAAPTAVICVLFSLLTFVFAIISTALWEVRSSLKNGAVSEAVSLINPLDLNAKDLITDTKALEKAITDIGIEDVEIEEADDDETLGEWIERTLKKYGTTEDDAERFLEESELMPYITEVAASYENYILTGEDDKPLTEKKIKAVAVKCMDYIADEFNCKLAYDYEQRIEDVLSDNKNVIKNANPSKALGDSWSYTRYVISLPVIIAAAVLALVFVMLSGVITRRLDAAFITLGIPMLLTGILFVGVGLVPGLVLDRVNIPNDVIGDSVEMLASGFTKVGFIEAAAGLIFIAAFIVYRVVATNLAKKKALRNA